MTKRYGFFSNQKLRRAFFWLVIIAGVVFSGQQLYTTATDIESDLVINEIVAANQGGLLDEDGDSPDWIELYNRSDQPLNLAGWSLTNDLAQPEKWRFPEITLGPGQYLLIFASGKDRKSGDILHANFKLNRSGDYLALYNVFENRWMDRFAPRYPAQFADIAYGRYGADQSYGYLAQPTPGQPNDDSLVWQDFVPPVRFSLRRGFYNAPFRLELTGPAADATIHYTTDGSQPNQLNGREYTAPLAITTTTVLRAVALKPGYLPSPVETQTYLFLDDVLAQKPPPDAQELLDYEMDPEIVAAQPQAVREALQTLPTLSIVAEPYNLDIYLAATGEAAEENRPVSIEWIEPDGRQFQRNADIKIHGSRRGREDTPKHSFRLQFRDALPYPPFPDSPLTRFDTLILRGGSDRSYAADPEDGDQHQTTYSRDEWLRASQIAISGVGAHGTFVHLYFNGLYWGLYNLVERPDAAFTSAYLGGPESSWHIANHNGPVSGPGYKFEALLRLAQLGQIESLAQITPYLDTAQFSDYVILHWYAGSLDWPDNNWYAAVQLPDGQVRYIAWDGELTWRNGALIELGKAYPSNTVKPIFETLIRNPDFRLEFADRLYRNLFNNGPLTDANAQARWRQINNRIEPAILAESARWGDSRTEPPITPQDWLAARDNVLAQMEGNALRLLAQARERGYYPSIDPPRFNHPGGPVEAGFALSMTAPGQIYYTTDGTDPRAPAAHRYTAPLILTATTQLKARQREGDTWSALNEALFTTGPARLSITEIMYHPVEGTDYEFIELKNNGQAPLELANIAFTGGITYTFPPYQPPLWPDQLIVLVRNREAFAQKYPGVPIGGVYNGKLNNNGETLTIRDAGHNRLLSLTYDDRHGWPITPDGEGDSLVPKQTAGDPNDPRHWRASRNLHGSPGQDDPP